jgi:DNA-binding transcriptional MerR regulator
MQIGEFARRAGVSPRALRHYEESELLVPHRLSNGYRDYDPGDLDTVARIRPILEAGLPVTVARTYLDCVATGEKGIDVTMCPGLRSALELVESRINGHLERLHRAQDSLCAFTAGAVEG